MYALKRNTALSLYLLRRVTLALYIHLRTLLLTHQNTLLENLTMQQNCQSNSPTVSPTVRVRLARQVPRGRH